MVKFRAPRLRKDWSEVDSIEESPGTTSTELFWNAIFSTSMVVVGSMIAHGHILPPLLAFEAFFHVWEASALYATRFADDDACHQIFWSAFGGATIVMLGACRLQIGAKSWALFPAATATAKMCLAVATIRVGWALPRCRKYAIFVATQHSVQALVFVLTATKANIGCSEHVVTQYWLFANVLGLAFDWLFIIVTEVISGIDLPLSIEYHAAKYQGFHILVLGAAVGLTGVSSTTQIIEEAYVIPALLSTATVIIFILAYKQILVDAAPKPHRHALHSKRRFIRLTWLFLQRILIAAIVSFGAGAQILVAAWSYNPQGTYLLSFSAAVMFLLLPGLRSLDAEKLDPRAAAVAILAAAFLALLPFCQPEPFVCTLLTAAAALFVVLATPDETSNPPLLRTYSSYCTLSLAENGTSPSLLRTPQQDIKQSSEATPTLTRFLELSSSRNEKELQYSDASSPQKLTPVE